MDKLKPILAQKFWILFSLVLMMPLAGYFMTKGKLAAEIEDRWKKLDGSFSGIPSGTGVPNDSWTNKLNEINNQQILHNRRANQELWLKQKERMFWPKDIAPIMAKAEYFKDLTEQQKGDQVIFKYPLSYESQLRALWEIVDPLDDGMNLRDSDKRRKIAFAMADLHQSSSVMPGTLSPTFAEIWGAQEDIWLQTELLNAIKRLNAGAISQGDAFVKQLGKIQLFGGAKSTGDASATASGGMTSGGGPAGDMPAMSMAMGGFGGGSRTEATALSADINLSEEFTVSMEAGGAGNPAAAMGSFGASSGGTAEVPAGGATGAAKSEVKRYIDFDDKQAYKRRGFYIKVTMDHRKVPDLIAELMNSPFPVEIIRVQQVWLSDTGGNTTGGGSGPMPGAAPGFSGFRPPSSGDAITSAAPPASAGFEAAADTTGFAASGSGGASGRSASNNPGSIAALADPNLAQVAILGVWTLYLPPPAADEGQAAPPNTGSPAPGLAATPENTTTPAESSAEAAATEAKPTAEPTDGTSDEAQKSDDQNAPKSEPAKPEKAESDSDTPVPEKAPPKDDAADSTDSKSN